MLPLKRHYSSGTFPGLSVQRIVWKKGFFSWKVMLQVSMGDWGLSGASLVSVQSAGRGGSRKLADALLGVHTPLEKSSLNFRDTSICRLT
jgi:hypothetical protein